MSQKSVMSMNANLWLLSPYRVPIALFVLQFFVWFFGMPEDPVTQGATPRFYSEVALFRYATLFSFLVFGIFGAFFFSNAPLNRKRPSQVRPENLRLLLSFAWWTGLLAIGSLGYQNRYLVTRPDVVISSLSSGLAHYATFVRENESHGASTLINLFSIPTAIYAVLYFHPKLHKSLQTLAGRRLMYLGAIIVTAAFLNAARMWLAQFAMITVAGYALYRPVRWRVVFPAVVIAMSCAWGAELSRWGVWYSDNSGQPVLSLRMQELIGRRLIEGYVAADLNNAFILLDDRPSMRIVGSAVSIHRVLAGMGVMERQIEGAPYDNVRNWTGIFGAVNVVGLLWHDLGWYAAIPLFGTGFWFGAIYFSARRNSEGIGSSVLFFLISVPGFFAFLRINYFGLSIFVVPFFALITFVILTELRERKGEGEGEVALAFKRYASSSCTKFGWFTNP